MQYARSRLLHRRDVGRHERREFENEPPHYEVPLLIVQCCLLQSNSESPSRHAQARGPLAPLTKQTGTSAGFSRQTSLVSPKSPKYPDRTVQRGTWPASV